MPDKCNKSSQSVVDRGEKAADKAHALIYPERTGSRIRKFFGDGVQLRRHMVVTSVDIHVELPSAATRDRKRLIRSLPKEIDGIPVVIEPVKSSCMFCSFKADTRREMQRHRCDA